MTVSVLIPVHNAGSYLRRAVESILYQTYRDFELVVVNDGSTDGSLRTLESLAASDPRIKLVTREKKGLIATRNELLERATGELLVWMDADDVSRPARLARQVETLTASPELVCVGSSVLHIDPEGMPIRIFDFPLEHDAIVAGMRLGGSLCFPAVAMRRSAAKEVGGFREPFRMGEDFDLFWRLGERGKLKNSSEVLLDYRQHMTSTSFLLSPQWMLYRDVIVALADERKQHGTDRLQRGLELEELLAMPRSEVGRDPAATRVAWARHALVDGYWSTARKHALAALKLDMSNKRAWRALLRAMLGIKHSAQAV